MQKYNLAKFEKAIKDYKAILKNVKEKTFLIVLDIDQKEAYYSLAPISMAIHELGGDINAQVVNKYSPGLDVLKDVWTAYDELKAEIKNPTTKALKEFIGLVNKKIKGFEKIFKAPEFYLCAGKKSFEGSFALPFNISWMEEYRKKDLLQTAKVVWNQVYDLKKTEKVSVGFELIRKKSDLGLPLEDYLDSYQISRAMMETVKEQVVAMGSSTSRKSQMDLPERISELRTTLLGCELSKDIDEPIFKKFKEVSRLLKVNRLKVASAVFGIHGKGYPGRHLFGEHIGYPSPNKKTRWLSPGMMVYKLDHYPQTKFDSRKPMARIGFTETLPIDIFIKTSNIDWFEMRDRDHSIIDLVKKSEYLVVEGKKFGKYQTKLKIGLKDKKGNRRRFRGSDIETRHLINPHAKKKGILAGTMANIPGGEAFGTPEWVKGQFIGDVVISLDQSYTLSSKDPFVIDCYGNSYKVIRGPKKVWGKFKEKKKEAWNKLIKQEKAKSMPKSLINLNKQNFKNIGEFAINTNPKAELCNYLIVNEKIANMIHIALGSGFDADRATYYHTDIVIDSPRQQLDIYGVTKNGEKLWIHKKGKFVV